VLLNSLKHVLALFIQSLFYYILNKLFETCIKNNISPRQGQVLYKITNLFLLIHIKHIVEKILVQANKPLKSFRINSYLSQENNLHKSLILIEIKVHNILLCFTLIFLYFQLFNRIKKNVNILIVRIKTLTNDNAFFFHF
jgi:hypothetical protein